MTKIFAPKITPGEWEVKISNTMCNTKNHWVSNGNARIVNSAYSEDAKAIAALPHLLKVIEAARDLLSKDDRNWSDEHEALEEAIQELDNKFGTEQ